MICSFGITLISWEISVIRTRFLKTAHKYSKIARKIKISHAFHINSHINTEKSHVSQVKTSEFLKTKEPQFKIGVLQIFIKFQV